MPSLYSVTLVLVSAAHLLLGVGNLLKVPPYNPAVFLVAGQVGAGDTGIEKLLAAIMAGWYTTSIIGVLAAYFTRFTNDSIFHPLTSCCSTRAAVRCTLLCPLLYHIMSTYMATFHVPSWGVCNDRVQSSNVILIFHSVLTAMFAFLFVKT